VSVHVDDEFVGGTMSLYTASGRLLREVALDDTSAGLELDDPPSGVYLVQVRTGDRVVTQRLVINR